jgi:hypothetical protein
MGRERRTVGPVHVGRHMAGVTVITPLYGAAVEVRSCEQPNLIGPAATVPKTI